MNKRLICLFMSILMLLTLAFTSCTGKKTDTEEEENTVDNSAKTITMWVMTDGETSPKAQKLVSEAFTKITKSRFKTNVVLKFCTEDEYYTKLEETINAFQADIDLKENFEKDLRKYLKAHRNEKEEEALRADFFAEHPEYEKFSKLEEEDDEEETVGEDETVVNEFGITEIKYPDEKENQVDIFYVSGYDKYMEYYKNEWLSSLNEELSTSSKKLNSYISKALLNGVQVDGGVYAIPNNVPIGEYTYMMIDKELFDKYFNKIDKVNSVLDLGTFLNDMKHMNGDLTPDDPDYIVPLASTYEECLRMLCWYWELSYVDQSVYNTYYDEKTGRNYVVKKKCDIKVQANDGDNTSTKTETVILNDVAPDVLYKIDENSHFVAENGDVLDYHYEIDPEGGYLTGSTKYDKKLKDSMYLVDGTGRAVTPENDRRVKVEATTKFDANGNVAATYHYGYNEDCHFSILGTMMKNAADRNRGSINLGFNSLFTNAEYRDMFATLMDYKYRDFYGTVKEGQKAAVSFMKGDSRIKQAYEKDGVYTQDGRDYYVVVAEYPEATEAELYGNMFAVYSNSPYLSRSMEVITYLNTNKELRNLLQYGVRGEHYELNEDGTAHLLTSSEEDFGTYRMDIEKTGNCFIAYPPEGKGADAWVYAKVQNNDSLINPLLGFDFNTATAESDYGLDVDLIDHINELSAEALALINECETKEDLVDLMGNPDDGFVRKYAASAGDEKLTKAMNPAYDPASPNGPDAGDEQNPDRSGSSPYTVYQTWLTNFGYAYVPSAED